MATASPITVPTRTARIPLEHANTPVVRLACWWSRRRYGAMLEPLLATMHNRRVLTSMGLLEPDGPKVVEPGPRCPRARRARRQRADRVQLVHRLGYFLSRNRGMDPAKLEGVADWRASDVYTSLERKVLEYAEAMTTTPPGVTDELVEDLRESLTDEQLVELTAMIALENLRSRTNSCARPDEPGFKDHS